MLVRHHGPALAQAAAPGIVDQLPGLVAGRIDEGAAAGAGADRLAFLALGLDVLDAGMDRLRIIGLPGEGAADEDPILRHGAVAVGETHLDRAEAMQLAPAVQR